MTGEHRAWLERCLKRSALCTVPLLFALAAFSCSAFDDPACSGFEDEPGESSVVVRARNESDVPLYFVAPSDSTPAEPFTLQQQGETVPWIGSPCRSCEAAKAGQSCTLIAAAPSLVEVPPKGHHDFEWDGAIRRQRGLPRGCMPFSGSNGTCEQAVPAPAGDYVVTLTAFAQHSCGGCNCASVFADGSCLVQGATPTETYSTQHAEIEHPMVDLVEFVFE